MKPIQNADVATGLVRRFGLRGRSIFALDELVVPTTDEGDFAGRSPWEANRAIAADVRYALAAVGNNSGIIIVPAAGHLVVVEDVAVIGTATVDTIHFKIFRPADLAAVTQLITSPSVRLNGVMQPSGLAQRGTTVSHTIQHTDMLDGALFQELKVNIQETGHLHSPRGVVLDGTDPTGPIMLAVLNTVQNKATTINYVVSEYRAER